MPSNVRRGQVGRAPQGIDDLNDELYTIKGFFGPWAHLFRRHNLAHPKSWSADYMMYQGADTNSLAPSDATDPAGSPLTLLTGDGIEVSISHRRDPMPFAERNQDYHQIRFYHRGEFTLDTEFGPLSTEPGDFVVIPKGIIFRESPKTTDNRVLIFEVAEPAVSAMDEMWDTVGFTNHFIDESRMEIPTPGQADAASVEVETTVRVKYGGAYETMVYDFDPCRDVVGWVGDPVVCKLNVWDIPGLGSSHGFLPPPTGAVFMAKDKSYFFNVLSVKPFPNEPAPNGSYGPPAHQNDYEEVWFNHASEHAPETDAHLWLMPTSCPHPGLKRPPEYPPNPVRKIRELKLNFDCTSILKWTDEAKQALMPDPQKAIYTSFYGAHIGIDPEQAAQHVKR
jgi:homogentisate 1,2-dioxygenase